MNPASVTSAVLTCLVFALPAAAQRSHTEGFLLNAHVGAVAGNVEDGDTELGGGFGLMAGYGFDERYQLVVNGDAMSLDVSNPEITGGYWLYQGDLGVRINFPDPERSFVGYIVGGVTGQYATGTITGSLNQGAEATLAGFGGTIGTGFHVFFTPALALDTVVQFAFGTFTHADIDDPAVMGGRLDDNLSNLITRLNIGLTWYAQAY